MTSNAPSPFLPGTRLQYVWDSTSLGWLKECPRKYQYQMIEGWRRKGTTSVHLVFGQHYHAALELYDKIKAGVVADFTEPFTHDSAMRHVLLRLLNWTWERPDCQACKGTGHDGHTGGCTDCLGTGYDGSATGPWESDHPSKNRMSLVRSVIWYLEEHQDDPVATLVLANGKPAVELTFKFDSGIEIENQEFVHAGFRYEDPEAAPTTTFMLSGHLDRIGLFQGDPYVLDRKTTTGSLDYRFFAQFNPHNQMSLYTIAGQIVFGTPVKGVMIEGAQVGAGFTRFARAFTMRTESLSEEFLRDLEPWLRAAELYASNNHWPKNELSCSNYGGCPFREVCGADPAVRDNFLRTQFERNPWNPLQER